VLFSLIGSLLVDPHSAQVGAVLPRRPPSAQHLLGTDSQGRDMLTMLVFGTPKTLKMGLIAGFIASKLYSGSGQGFLMDIVLGIVGAVLGGYLFTAIGATGITGFNLYSMFVAVIGAVVLLAIYHAVMGRSG